MFVTACDTETTGLSPYIPPAKWTEPARPFTVSFCDQLDWKNGFVIRAQSVDIKTRKVTWHKRDRKRVIDLLTDCDRVYFHNPHFDLKMLWFGISERLVRHLLDSDKVYATDIQTHVINSYTRSKKLKDLGVYVGIDSSDEEDLQNSVLIARREARRRGEYNYVSGRSELFNTKSDYWLPGYYWGDHHFCDHYAILDAKRTLLLGLTQQQTLDKSDPIFQQMADRERALIKEIFYLSLNGLRVRPTVLERERKTLERELTLLRDRIQYRGQPLNPNSTKQVNQVFDSLHAPTFAKTPSGNRKLDAESMELYSLQPGKVGELATLILENSRLTKAQGAIKQYKSLSTHDQRLHASINQVGTVTTRMSTSDPNLQNVSKREGVYPLRAVFGPAPGYTWWAIDYDQLEIRLIAHSSGDPTYRRMLEEGLDQHQFTADLFSIPRFAGKQANFAWQYGAGPKKLSMIVGQSAQIFIDRMTHGYPGVVKLQHKLTAFAKKHGYVDTLFGYRLMLPEDQRKATNSHIQGSAGDAAKLSILDTMSRARASRWHKNYGFKLINMIHDELLFETSAKFPVSKIKIIGQIMANQGQLINCDLPVSVSKIPSGKGWHEKQELFTIHTDL